MKTLATSNSIVTNTAPSSYFSASSLKERLLSGGPEFISYRRHWKLASSELQHLVPLRPGGIDLISCFSSQQQVSSLVGFGNSFFVIVLRFHLFFFFFFFLKNLGLRNYVLHRFLLLMDSECVIES